MVSKSVLIQNETGLHARPASQLTQFCKQFPEDIKLVGNDKEVDPKSIVALLSAGMKRGVEIEVQVNGENEEAVCDQVVEFISNLAG